MVSVRSIGVLTAAALMIAAPGMAPLDAQNRDERKEQQQLEESQRREIQALVRAVDEVMKTQAQAGTHAVTVPAGNDAPTIQAAESPVTWQNHSLKAQEGRVYMPFTIGVDPAAVGPSSAVAVYLRVAPRGATGPAPPPSGDNKKKEAGKKEEDPGPYPFEDVYFTDLKPAATGGPALLRRAFAVAPGDYDVYVALRPRAAQGADAKAPVRVTVLKEAVTAPNYWSDEFTTSAIIVADKAEALSSPPSSDVQRERPYILGSTEIVPAQDDAFKHGEEMTVLFQIYNPTYDANKKPDVTVEYNFLTRTPEGEKPFNRMEPQTYNAASLPPGFDPDAGYQLAAGWSLPVDKLPPGDYRLEIKITDNLSKKTITRDVNFSVQGP